MSRFRVTPLNAHLDADVRNLEAAVAEAHKRLLAAGFAMPEDSHFEVRDGRAIDGEDSGSPIHVLFKPKKKEPT